MLKGFVTVAEAAVILGRSASSVRAFAPSIKGAVKVGKTWLIPEKELPRVKFPRAGHRRGEARLEGKEPTE